LVEDELQRLVVGADDERAALKVRAPVVHCLDEADELAFISCEAAMLREREAKEGNCTVVLVERCADAGAGRITLNREAFGEIGQGEHRRYCQSLLQHFESVVGLR